MKGILDYLRELFGFYVSGNEEKPIAIHDDLLSGLNQEIPPVDDIEVEEPEKIVKEILAEDDSTTDTSAKVVVEETYTLREGNCEDDVKTELYEQQENREDKNNIPDSSSKKSQTLLNSFAEIITEFDSYYQRTSDEDAKKMIEMMQYRLIEILEKNGGIVIDDDKSFSAVRHIPVPFSIVDEGTEIKAFLRKGIMCGNDVILKAKVKII